MNLKNQPQIRVIDPESKYFGEVFDVEDIHHGSKRVCIKMAVECFSFDQIQELTPLSFEGTRIGVGDRLTRHNQTFSNDNLDVVGWEDTYQDKPQMWVNWLGDDYDPNSLLDQDWIDENIDDHTPLTEMKKENEDKTIGICSDCHEFREDLGILTKTCGDCCVHGDDDKPTDDCSCDAHRPCSQHAPDDKPTIRRIRERVGSGGVTENIFALYLHDLEKAIADAGIINLKDE